MFSGLCSNLNKQILANNLNNIAGQISNCRIILRLLDDFSMLSYTLSYGLGKHVGDCNINNKN
jgi:hypothetical protein